MIGFNGTYLAAASLGNMRITSAALGGQWVMGGKWLKTATMQAIIAAFGAEEGAQVIRKTNEYLNAIAATDTQRAQQLAMFINEDPMLVCSLVETHVIRSIKSLGSAWFDTGLQNESNDVEYYCEWKEARNSASWSLFGSTGASSTPGRWSAVWYHPLATEIYSATGNTDRLLHNSYTVNGWNTLTAKYKNGAATATLNGNAISGTYSGSVQNNRNIALFADKNANSAQEIAPSGIELRIWQKKESNATHTIVPFIRNGAAELLILETGELCTKYGSFTIQLTDK